MEFSIGAARAAKIEAMMGERGVPKPAAIIIVDEGYSKGHPFRIYNDEFKRKTAPREAAHAAEKAKAGAA